MRKSITKSVIWKFLERIGVTGGQFVLQIVLARILSPENYGTLAIMLIFTSLATTFVQSGFGSALVQNKDVDENDYSSVFWISFFIAAILYVVIFFSAPFIGRFYNMPDIVSPLRVLALTLFSGALNSVQNARVNRAMDFRKTFNSNVIAIIVSGVVGIVLALLGAGVWALVANAVVNSIVICVVMRVTVNLKLRLYVDFKRVKTLFSFSWKLLVSSLIDTLYTDLRSLVIGKRFNSETLGFYDKGKAFPKLLITSFNTAVQSVMFSALSAEQDDKKRAKNLMRSSIIVSTFLVFPAMVGLAAVAEPVVLLLLGSKWLPAVPFMQIYCLTFAFYPIHTCNLQAINAIGRSDIFLKLEIIKKSYGLLSIAIAVIFFDTPVAIALTGLITTFISSFVNASPNKKLIGYAYSEQIWDILPALLCAIVMGAGVIGLSYIPLHPFIKLPVQIIAGIIIYLAEAYIFKLNGFDLAKRVLINLLKRPKKTEKTL